MMADRPIHERAKSLLDAVGMEGLLVYTRGTSNILRPNYFHYITGVKPFGPHQAFLLSRSGEAVVLVEPAWDARRIAKKSWVKTVRGSHDFLGELAALMKEMGVSGSVGVAGGAEMNLALYDRIQATAPITPVEREFEEMALERTTADVALARKSAQIAELGFDALLKHSRVGIKEYELIAEVEAAMLAAGAEDNFILLSSGPRNRAMHPPTERRLEEGDVIILELTPVYEGHFSQLCRTIQLGKPNPLLAEKMEFLASAYEAGLAQIRDGASVAVMCKAINKVISDGGYGEWCYPPHIRTRGHGFGVGSVKPGGVLDEDSKEILRTNQVLVVHPNQFVSEVGYLACGETILVTDSGYERLTDPEGKSRLFTVEV